jgi:hypothetical protein
MKKIRNGLRGQQSGKRRADREKNAFEALLRSCEKLPIAKRKRFIFLLLKHVSLLGGTASYVAWGEWNLSDVRTAYLNLSDISTDLADSWFEWAKVLSNAGSSGRPRERVFCLIGELITQISMEQEVNQWLRG